MQFENLEQRVLLSISLSGGVLSIVGTNKNDSLSIFGKGADTVVKSSFAAEQHFQLNAGNTIKIDMLGGNDTVTIADATIHLNTTILGGSGNDLLDGGAGNDLIDGGAGADTLFGDGGDDHLVDTTNDTVMDGEAGFDAADFSGATTPINFKMAGKNVEMVSGGSAGDSITGTASADVIIGNGGNDTINGLAGDDTIDGGAGHDKLFGGDGNDLFINYDQESDVIDGGAGMNFAQEDIKSGKSLDTQTNIFELFDRKSDDPDGDKDDTLPKGKASTKAASTKAAPLAVARIAPAPVLRSGILSITGTAGNDSISLTLDKTGRSIGVSVGRSVSTFSLASVRQINIDAGDGNDSVSLQRSDGTRAVPIGASILGGNGDDSITGGAGADSIFGGNGNDQIFGMAGNDNLNGNIGDDTINGGDGNDLLNGAGNHFAIADGADVIRGGNGSDTVDYSERFHGVSVDLSVGGKANDGEKGEGDDVGTDVENIFGGDAADLLIGNAASNLISGGGGNDTILGGAGHDKLIGGPGQDSTTSGADLSLFALLDFTRDSFNGKLDKAGRPVNALVSGDVGMDFSTASRVALLVGL
jgi:Ca2+-binding RTX toxin-like protein